MNAVEFLEIQRLLCFYWAWLLKPAAFGEAL